MKRIIVFTLLAFVLALFFDVAAAMAQDNPGGMDNTPGGGTSNTPGGGYEHQSSLAGGALYAQGGMSQTGQQDPGMSNATGLPTLSGDYSSTFESGSMESAQQVCDEVARANNKANCAAASVTTQGTAPGVPPRHMYYCICK